VLHQAERSFAQGLAAATSRHITHHKSIQATTKNPFRFLYGTSYSLDTTSCIVDQGVRPSAFLAYLLNRGVRYFGVGIEADDGGALAREERGDGAAGIGR